MQATNTRVNRSSLFRVGIVIGLLALGAYGVQNFYGVTATTTTQPVAQVQPAEEGTMISRGDAYLYTSNDKDYEGCTYADDVGLAFCQKFVIEIAERRDSGRYAAKAPAGWCNATDCNQVDRDGRLVKVDMP